MKKPEKEMQGVMRALRQLHKTGSIDDKIVSGMPASYRMVARGLAVWGPVDPATGLLPLIITDHGINVLKESAE